jgi:hypothetical protein
MDEQPEIQSISAPRQRPLSSWSLLVSGTGPASPGIRVGWRELVESSDDPFVLYQSPEWFDHVRTCGGLLGTAHSLAIRRDPHRGLVAVVPLFLENERCRLPLVLGRFYQTRSMEMVVLKSGNLLMRPGGEWFNGLFSALLKRFPRRPIKIENIPLNGPLHRYLHTSPMIAQNYLFYRVPYLERVHVVSLPATYNDFMEQYSAKKRYNLRRQLRLLSEQPGGKLQLRSYQSVEDAADLCESYGALLRAYDAAMHDPLAREDMTLVQAARISQAKHGIERSYVLKLGDRPVSCCVGSQVAKTCLVLKTVYDPAYAAFSPGTVLLHLVIEDLINKGVTHINMGYGDPLHELRSTNVVLDYCSYWLLPNTPANRCFHACHTAFRRAVTAMKRFAPRRRRGVSGPPHASA